MVIRFNYSTKTSLIILASCCATTAMFFFLIFDSSSPVDPESIRLKRLEFIQFTEFSTNSTQSYRNQCLVLFKKLRYPLPEMLFEVPPQMPPNQRLKDAFEDFGNMKIRKLLYFNHKYSDSANSLANAQIPIVSTTEIEGLQQKALNKQPYGTYGSDTTIHELLVKYNRYVKNRNGLVIGTNYPWIEALIMLTNASSVTTLEYTYKKYESANMNWLHVNDYLDESIRDKGNFERFDFSVSFSSIEHSGLGRYGDPLSPYGDLEAVQQIHCSLKPGGMLLIGLPCSSNKKDNYIEYNAHRIYGKSRLDLLFGNNWEFIDESRSTTGHTVFVYKKKKIRPSST